MQALPDKRLWKKHKILAGVDEAGRGPLAGPVVAAAVVLPQNYHNKDIDDSKKLTARHREDLYKIICETALSYTFGVIDATVIDEINILNATKLAMKKAVEQLTPLPKIILIDALYLNDVSILQVPIIKGDSLSISIAAASILAKVYRDRLMVEYHKQYPQYRFDLHKGYATKLHRDSLKKHGPCKIHRKSFHYQNQLIEQYKQEHQAIRRETCREFNFEEENGSDNPR